MPEDMSEHTHPHPEAPAESADTPASPDSHPGVDTVQPDREEFGESGIEYVVLMRRPDAAWELYDGQVHTDPQAAAQALADATADLATRASRLWEVLKATPDSHFMEVALDYERSKGAHAALFARAVSSFVAV